MDWKAIRKEWESGNHEIAVRLLRAMTYEIRFKQRFLSDFAGSSKSGEGDENDEGNK